jgi:hypothetical protein
MFASNFCILDTHLKHNRGEDNLKTFSQDTTIEAHNVMTNYFCSSCGSLMYRRGAGFPGVAILRLGTLDDFHLMEQKFKPRVEQYAKDRVNWLQGGEGVKQYNGSAYNSKI